MWQAGMVKQLLLKIGCSANIVAVDSLGDVDLQTPLYELGVQGIFTRSLDVALLSNKIDIAVHSYKDVPTQLPKGLKVAAVLPRASHHDVFVPSPNCTHEFLQSTREPKPGNKESGVVATSSLRRKAQWLNRFPNNSTENIRGNVNTRMLKLQSENWSGALFAAAGLERIGLLPANAIALHWMLPAPAQGAIVICCREDDEARIKVCASINHVITDRCTSIERKFLRLLQGGCTTPISALVKQYEGLLHARGAIHSLDGQQKAEVDLQFPTNTTTDIAEQMVEALYKAGGDIILKEIIDAKEN